MHVHYGLLAVAIFALGLGLFMLTKSDAMWRFTQWRNRASGVATGERSETWERTNRLAAAIVLMTGLGAGFGFWKFDQIVAEEEARRGRARELPQPSVDLNLGENSDS